MIRPMLFLAMILATTTTSAHFPIAHRLRQMDSNHDRALSLKEVLSARQARFAGLDLDRNQVLTPAEISNKVSLHHNQGALDRTSKRFSRLDTNHDNRVTQAEWVGKVTELFASFDTNNDHLITRPEVRSVRLVKRSQR